MTPALVRTLAALLWLGGPAGFGATAPAPHDEPTAVVGAEPAEELPEFEVRDTRPWSCVEVPGCEILSLASPRDTTAYATRVRAEQGFLRVLLPATVPRETHRVFLALLGDPASLRATREPSAARGKIESRSFAGGDDRVLVLRPNLDTSGLDRPAFFGTDREFQPLGRPTSLSRAQVEWTLQHHREIPTWYRHGLQAVFLSLSGAERDRLLFTGFALSHSTWQSTGLLHAVFEDPDWDPRDTSGHYRHATPTEDGAAALAIFPLHRLFAVTDRFADDLSATGLSRDEQVVFRDHCELFLHWGLLADGGKHREALHRFVAAAVGSPVDETRFSREFGFDFAAAEKSLARYLTVCAKTEVRRLRRFAETKAAIELGAAPGSPSRRIVEHADSYVRGWIKRPGTWWFRAHHELPLPADERERVASPLAVRSASREEVARLVGEACLWSAILEAKRHRPRSESASAAPEAAAAPAPTTGLPFANSRVALQRSYDEGDRDPRLLAAIGLLELKSGRRTEARRYFEDAAAARVERPAVYLELARLRLGDAFASPAGPAGRPSDAQLLPVHELVHEALRLFPDLLEAQVLSASLWSLRSTPPPADELAVLVRAARHRPWETLLVVHAATLQARTGDNAEAAALARLGTEALMPGTPPELSAALRRLAAEAKF